jgi:hypothetical protein
MHFLKINGLPLFRMKSVLKDHLVPTSQQDRTSRILSGEYIGHGGMEGEKRLMTTSISHIQLERNVQLRPIRVISDTWNKTSFRVYGASEN